MANALVVQSQLTKRETGNKHQITEESMYLNAMAKAAKRLGLTIPELLQQRRENVERAVAPRSIAVKPKRRDPFHGFSIRELYMRRQWIEKWIL